MFTSEYISVIHMNQISGWKVDGIGNQVRRNFTWGGRNENNRATRDQSKDEIKADTGIKASR